jgi:hypothetical protein
MKMTEKAGVVRGPSGDDSYGKNAMAAVALAKQWMESE